MLTFATFMQLTTLIICSENMGYYWETKTFMEGDYEVSFHYRKLFTREFTRIKSVLGFDPNEVARLCLSNGGAPPRISELDKSVALREFLTLDVFQPYLVSNKYPAHHGFYLSTRVNTKAALWILRGGTFRVDFWQKPSHSEGENLSNPSTPLDIGIASPINFATGERQHPDDVVCMQRRLVATVPPTLPPPKLTTPTETQDSDKIMRCLSPYSLVDYNKVLSVLESSTGTANRNSTHGMRETAAAAVGPSSQLSSFDWFLIRHRFWLMATGIFSFGVLCLMLLLVSYVCVAIYRREDKTPSTPSNTTACKEENESSATALLLDDTCCSGEVVKRPKVVHVPNSQIEYGAIAARRQRDHARRSISNMRDCEVPSPIVYSYTSRPTFSSRPAVVTDCGDNSIAYSDEEEQRFGSTFRMKSALSNDNGTDDNNLYLMSRSATAQLHSYPSVSRNHQAV